MLPVHAEDGSLRLVVFNKPRKYLDDLLCAVLDASPDGILGLRRIRSTEGHIQDAIVITANQRAADFIGCTVENLVDHPILEVIPKLRGTKTWARYLEVVETRQPQVSRCRFTTRAVQSGLMSRRYRWETALFSPSAK